MKKIILFCFFSISLLFAQPITVKVRTEASHYMIGDYIRLFVTVTNKPDVKFAFPSLKDSLPPLEFISKDKEEKKVLPDGKTQTDYQLTFAAFDSADFYLKAFSIPYTVSGDSTAHCLQTDSIFLTVRRVMVDTTVEIRDIKPPERESFPWGTFFLILYIAIVLVVVGYYIYKLYFKDRKKEVSEPVVIKTPYEEAYEKLQQLEAKELWQNGYVKEYHSEITEIVRRYFETVFHIPALEETSGEIVQRLKNVNAPWSIIVTTEEFLSNADMVKFAKFSPMPHVNSAMMTQAYKIIEGEKSQEGTNESV